MATFTSCFVFLTICISHFLSLAVAFDITAKPLDGLKLSDKILGIHSTELKHSTPPSTVISSWYVLMKKGNKDAAKIGHGCPDDSSLCGIITFDTDKDGSKPIQLLSLNDNDAQYDFDFTSEPELALIRWKSIKYGDYNIDVSISLQCNDLNDNDILEWSNNTSSFIDSNVDLVWKNKEFCTNDNKNGDGKNDKNKDKDDSDSGLGLFGMLFLIGVVAFAGYIVAQAWFNTSTMGSSSDFFNELVDIAVESLSSIPRLAMEIVNKITGSGSNSSRGGYSAV